MEDKNTMIKNLLNQHQTINDVIKNHYQKEILSQEDEFNRKMNERRERSVERSVNKEKSNRDIMSLKTIGKSNNGGNHSARDEMILGTKIEEKNRNKDADLNLKK